MLYIVRKVTSVSQVVEAESVDAAYEAAQEDDFDNEAVDYETEEYTQ